MSRVLWIICALVVLPQCAPRPHAGESMDDLISGLALERNDLILELGTGVAVANDRTRELVSRGASAIPKLRAALLDPSGKVAGFAAFCLEKLKARECEGDAAAALKHWQAKEPSFDNHFAMAQISQFIHSLQVH